MATIRFTRDFSAVFELLSLLGADNMVKIEYSSPDGDDSDTDHWIQIRDVMSLGLEMRVNSLTVLEETMDMAEIYSATGYCDGEPNEDGLMFCPISIEDIQDDWDDIVHEEELANLLAVNIQTCVNHKEFVGPIEPLEQMLMRLDLPF